MEREGHLILKMTLQKRSVGGAYIVGISWLWVEVLPLRALDDSQLGIYKKGGTVINILSTLFDSTPPHSIQRGHIQNSQMQKRHIYIRFRM